MSEKQNIDPKSIDSQSTISRTKGYHSTIFNPVAQDPTLSAMAKAIYMYAMSCSDSWQVRVYDLPKRMKEGRDTIRKGLKDLEEHGLVRRYRVKRDDNPNLTKQCIEILYEPKHQQKSQTTEIQEGGDSVGNKDYQSKKKKGDSPSSNTPKKRKSASRKSDKGKPRTRNPRNAPWNGKDYSDYVPYTLEDENDLHGYLDSPELCIECAIDVTGDNSIRGYGKWIKMLNKAVSEGKTLSAAISILNYCILKTFRENKVDELSNPPGYFTHLLKKELSE